MGYMQEVDHWLESQLDLWLDEKISDEELKRSICDKILESYKNGLKAAGQSPAPRGNRSPRRFPQRANAA